MAFITRVCRHRPILSLASRRLLSDASSELSEGEKHLISTLKTKFPGATFVQVQDISGGCGSMYEVQIEAKEFTGKRTVQQHRMVNEALKSEISNMHGLRISTAISKSTDS